MCAEVRVKTETVVEVLTENWLDHPKDMKYLDGQWLNTACRSNEPLMLFATERRAISMMRSRRLSRTGLPIILSECPTEITIAYLACAFVSTQHQELWLETGQYRIYCAL